MKLAKSAKVILSRVSGERPHEEHDYDGLRLIMHNFDKQFVDVPVISVQSDLSSERDWLLSAHKNEAFKAFAICFIMRDLAEEISPEGQSPELDDKRAETISKLTFMYHYVMNFRSKYTRELRTNVRRRIISELQHE